MGGILLHFVAVKVIEGDSAWHHLGKLKVSNVVDISCVFKDCRNIGGDIGFAIVYSDDHGAVFTGYPDFSRVILEHQLQGIASPDSHHGLGNGIDGTDAVFLVVVVHKLYDHFSICLAVESISMLQELILQLLIVFNDSIVDSHHFRFHFPASGGSAVSRYMGMGIGYAGLSMGGPSGVADAAGADKGLSSVSLVVKEGKTAFCLYHFSILLTVPDSKAS